MGCTALRSALSRGAASLALLRPLIAQERRVSLRTTCIECGTDRGCCARGWYSSVHMESGPTGTSARNLEADAGETAAQLQRKAVLHSSYLARKRTQRERERASERERET